VVDVCVNCERDVPLVAFDAEVGARCVPTVDRHVDLAGRAGLIRRIMSGDLASVLREDRRPAPASHGDRARFDRGALRQATARDALDAAALAAVHGR